MQKKKWRLDENLECYWHSLQGFLTISCDQITKSKIRQELAYNEVVNIVEDTFVLTGAENSGAAMGLGSSLPQIWKLLFLQFLPLLVLLYMFRIIWTREISIIKVLAFSLIIGGGIGNIYDRVFRSSVTDFLCVNLELVRTGIFNLAYVSVMTEALIMTACSFSKVQRKQIIQQTINFCD